VRHEEILYNVERQSWDVVLVEDGEIVEVVGALEDDESQLNQWVSKNELQCLLESSEGGDWSWAS